MLNNLNSFFSFQNCKKFEETSNFMNTLTLNPNPDLKITMNTSRHNSSTHIPYMMQQSTILFAQRICRISSCLYLLMFQSSFDYCTLETGLDCTLHRSYILLNDPLENLSYAYISVKNWKNAVIFELGGIMQYRASVFAASSNGQPHLVISIQSKGNQG